MQVKTNIYFWFKKKRENMKLKTNIYFWLEKKEKT